MDKFAEKMADKLDSIVFKMKRFNLKSIRQSIFGVRAEGEPIPEPKVRTLEANNRPPEFEWYQEFRVGSLHGVNQKVHFDR